MATGNGWRRIDDEDVSGVPNRGWQYSTEQMNELLNDDEDDYPPEDAAGRTVYPQTRKSSPLRAASCVCFATISCFMLLTILLLSIPSAALVAWFSMPSVFDRTSPVVFDYRENQPSAVALLSPAGAAYRVLVPGQVLEASLTLRLPDSEHNRAIGMFQVSAHALSPAGEILASSSTPCMLKYRSIFVRTVRSAVLALPLLWGLIEERQTLHVRLLRHKEGVVAVNAIRVVLEPAAGVSARAGLPQLYDARIRIRVLLWASSPLLAVWPVSLFIFVLCCTCCWGVIGSCIWCRAFGLPGLTFLFNPSKPSKEGDDAIKSQELVVGIPVSVPNLEDAAGSHVRAPHDFPHQAPSVAPPARQLTRPEGSRYVGVLPPAPEFVPGVSQVEGVQDVLTAAESAASRRMELAEADLDEQEAESQEVERVLRMASQTLTKLPTSTPPDEPPPAPSRTSQAATSRASRAGEVVDSTSGSRAVPDGLRLRKGPDAGPRSRRREGLQLQEQAPGESGEAHAEGYGGAGEDALNADESGGSPVPKEGDVDQSWLLAGPGGAEWDDGGRAPAPGGTQSSIHSASFKKSPS